MDWQDYIADVGGELDPETGFPAFREIIVTVPRQNGKTTLVLCFEVERCVMWPGRQRVTYTAQTGKDAREKLIEDQAPLLEATDLWKATGRRVYRAIGSESIIFKDGSRIGIQASGEESGHGKTVDLGVIDESFADEDDVREQSILPGMLTKPHAQLLVPSTMGTERSVYLNRKVELGRQAVLEGRRSGIAYFEWSASKDQDPDSEETWKSCMPAYGITINRAAVEHARATMSDSEFKRAMLNQPTLADDRFIGAEVWAKVNSTSVAPNEPFSFALEINPERTWAAIAVAGPNGVVELIEHHEGTGWILEALEQLRRQQEITLVVDEYGPAASYMAEIRALGIRVVEYATKDVAWAASRFYDDLVQAKLAIRSHPSLDTAAAAVGKRPTGDSWVFARKNDIDVSCFIAGVLAYDHATQRRDNDVWVHF